jgi:hypothetical protein
MIDAYGTNEWRLSRNFGASDDLVDNRRPWPRWQVFVGETLYMGFINDPQSSNTPPTVWKWGAATDNRLVEVQAGEFPATLLNQNTSRVMSVSGALIGGKPFLAINYVIETGSYRQPRAMLWSVEDQRGQESELLMLCLSPSGTAIAACSVQRIGASNIVYSNLGLGGIQFSPDAPLLLRPVWPRYNSIWPERAPHKRSPRPVLLLK